MNINNGQGIIDNGIDLEDNAIDDQRISELTNSTLNVDHVSGQGTLNVDHVSGQGTLNIDHVSGQGNVSGQGISQTVEVGEFIYDSSCDKSCCVCFSDSEYIKYINKQTNEEYILSLADISRDTFVNNFIPDHLLLLSCCKIHYICTTCIRKIVNNYENHPINEDNSHLCCPFPFSDCITDIGFKNVFDHNHIKKLLSDQEWSNYINYAERYVFPGYTILKCPIQYVATNGTRTTCNSDILIENEQIKTLGMGELIVQCDQNEMCLRRFCYNCTSTINYSETLCYDCKMTYENENPNVYNYYFNKNYNNPITQGSGIITTISNLEYDESSYLFKNYEITEDIAVEQLLQLIKDVNTFIICPICKNSLYKTEKCNGLSHHNLERCYACSRIGFNVKGLGDHWNTNGIGGCYRFDHESFVKKYAPHYICNDNICNNHDKGDCTIQEHQDGIQMLEKIRKKAYVYHVLKSLLPNIRFNVYDKLYESTSNTPTLLELLPFKQSLVLLTKFKKHNRDYSEDILYQELECENPTSISEFITNKLYYIEAQEYFDKHLKKKDLSISSIIITARDSISTWRLNRNNTRFIIEDDQNDTTPHINNDSDDDDDIQLHTEYDPLIITNTVDTMIEEILQEYTDTLNVDHVSGQGHVGGQGNNTHPIIQEENEMDISDVLISQPNQTQLPSLTLNSYSLLINLDSDEEEL